MGTLILTQQENYTSTTAITQGILQLGVSNAIRFNQNLRLEDSGTLDLAGFNQTVDIFLNDVTQPDSTGAAVGGRIINSASATTQSTFVSLTDNTTRNFAGVIGGGVGLNNIAWQRAGVGTFVVYSNNDYTGPTFLAGGTTTLESDGALSGTSAITIGFATLTLDNNSGLSNNNNRINDSAPITLIGGTISFANRAQTLSSEVMGALTIGVGASTISMTQNNTGVNSGDLYFASLVSVAPGATLNFRNGRSHREQHPHSFPDRADAQQQRRARRLGHREFHRFRHLRHGYGRGRRGRHGLPCV